MMTCVSDKSGIASSGMLRAHQTAPSIATTAKISTTNLLWADHSMIFSISPLWCRTGCDSSGTARAGSGWGRLLAMLVFSPAHPLQRGFQATLGVDQEIAAGDNDLTFGDTACDLVVALRLDPDRHITRLKESFAFIDKDDLLGPRVKHGLFRDGEPLASRHGDRGVHEHLRLEDVLRIGQDRPDSGGARGGIQHRVD